MTEQSGPGRSDGAPPGPGTPGWVGRHKVWTAIIVVTALVTLGSFVPSGRDKAASSEPQAFVSSSPTPEPAEPSPSSTVEALAAATTPPPAPPARATSAAAVVVAPRRTASPTPSPTPARVATRKPAAALTCLASVSDAQPSQYSTVYVYVKVGRPSIAVHTVAHYKSTDTAHDATTGADGRATVAYRISRASSGYTVVVDVTVSGGPSCQTSFTPQ